MLDVVNWPYFFIHLKFVVVFFFCYCNVGISEIPFIFLYVLCSYIVFFSLSLISFSTSIVCIRWKSSSEQLNLLHLFFFSLFDVRYRRICHHAHSLSSRFWWCLFLWFHFNSIANIQTHYTCICGSFDYNFLHFSLTIIFIHPHKLVCICARLLDFILMDGTWYLFFPFEYHKMHWKQEKNGN